MKRILSLIGVVLLIVGCSQSESVGSRFGTFENCFTSGPNSGTCESYEINQDGSVVYSTGMGTSFEGSVSPDQITRGSFSVSLSGFSVELGRGFQMTESLSWTNGGWVGGVSTFRKR